MATSTPYTFYPSKDRAQNDWIVAILDRAGIDYRQSDSSDDTGKGVPRLELYQDVIAEFDRQELIDFLWARGAKFEDS